MRQHRHVVPYTRTSTRIGMGTLLQQLVQLPPCSRDQGSICTSGTVWAKSAPSLPDQTNFLWVFHFSSHIPKDVRVGKFIGKFQLAPSETQKEWKESRLACVRRMRCRGTDYFLRSWYGQDGPKGKLNVPSSSFTPSKSPYYNTQGSHSAHPINSSSQQSNPISPTPLSFPWNPLSLSLTCWSGSF